MSIKIVRQPVKEAIPAHNCPMLVPLRVEKVCAKPGEIPVGCDMGDILVALPGQGSNVASMFNATKGIVVPLTNLHNVLCSVAKDIRAVEITSDDR
jgi:hypothetical protein